MNIEANETMYKDIRSMSEIARLCPVYRSSLYDLVESRYQRLRKPETENQLRPRHQQLRRQAFEETCESLLFRHPRDYLQAALWVIEIPILDPRLDNIQRRRHNKGRRSPSNRRDEILKPASLVIILQLEKILLRSSRSTKKCE